MKWTNRSLAFALLTVSLLPGCFGRSPADGLAFADGQEGDPCERDAECEFGLGCFEGTCGTQTVARAEGPPPQQDVREDSAVTDISTTADVQEDDTAPDIVVTPGFDCINGDQVVSGGSQISGSTVTSSNRVSGVCGGQRAPETRYLVRVEESGTYTFAITWSDYDTVMYLSEACGEDAEFACNDDDPASSSTNSFIRSFLDPGDYVLTVDGFGDDRGAFELTVDVAN
ncbi:MAG: hypothetical protein KC561_09815 [Myxococcales bacterium]|nr:hypothetical protein [Myxococcales bacterium]